MSPAEAVFRWWIGYSIIAVAFAPLAWWMAAGLGRYRHAFVRPIGLVVATFVLWWPAAMAGLPFTRETVIAAVLIGGIASWLWLYFFARSLLKDLSTLAVFEVLWFCALASYAWFRAANPDIANTEKPMEIALLSSVVRSSEVPAPDPWFAGSPINYYYFGYQRIASLIHLTGVQPTVAFNLMLGSLFASTVTGAAGFGAWLATRLRLSSLAVAIAAIFAAFFVSLAGNLETASRLVRNPGATIEVGWWDGVGWQASRVIVDSGVNGAAGQSETINEFPAFSFVLGDLHTPRHDAADPDRNSGACGWPGRKPVARLGSPCRCRGWIRRTALCVQQLGRAGWCRDGSCRRSSCISED